MSVLHYKSRPWVVFDPTIKVHRRWYAEFHHSGTWGRCPVRFMVADDQGDLVTMIQRRLIEYYVQKEFAK
jgi:hypothetical protein